MNSYTYDKVLRQIKNPYTYPGEDYLSDIQTDNIDVNSTIKPIDRKAANVELEKKEYVLQPTGNLYRVLGNSHGKGGTPVKLPENSFIFSNHKPLAINKKDKEMFSFKEGGVYTKNKNTPANVLKREVDTEHHNRMIAVMGSNDKDDVSKKSASLMLQKNFKKLGQVAFLQEEKKGFPAGVPTFSQGTAPVKSEEVKDADDMQKQYKWGGLKKYQDGSWVDTPENRQRVIGQAQLVDEAPLGANPLFTLGANNSYYNNGMADASNLYTGNYAPQDPNSWFPKLVNSPYTFEQRVAKRQFQDTPTNRAIWQKYNGKFGNSSYVSTHSPLDVASIDNRIRPSYDWQINPNSRPMDELVNPVAPPSDNSSPSTDTEEPVLPYNPKVPFNDWQKGNIGYAAFNASTIGKYYPKRAQSNFVPLNLERTNPQPYLNQIGREENQAYSINNVLNPILARSNNSSVYGQGLDKSSDVLGNVDNQNRQISNQENMYNNQGVNSTALRNIQFDQNYYDAVQRTNQNYERESRTARNQIVSLANQFKSQNEELEFNLASQPTFGTKDVYVDPVTKRIFPNEQAIPPSIRNRVVKRKQSAPVFDWNLKTNNIYYTGAGLSLDNLPTSNSNRISEVISMAKSLQDDAGLDQETAGKVAAYLLKYNDRR